jgi:hypothetical protein
MARETLKPSVARIIQSDYIAMIAALAPIVMLGLYIALNVFGSLPGRRGQTLEAGETGPFFLVAGLAALVIGVAVIVWRLRTFEAVFAAGVEVTGEITNLSFHRDRGRIEYIYSYEGQEYSGGNAIMKNSRTTTLQPGTPIVLVVDRANPRKALIRDLYV